MPKGESADKDGFQKLMEQKQSSEAPANPKQERPEAAQKETQEAPQEPQETVQTVPADAKELEDRMLLAAMAMMQNPVVPAEEVLTPEVQTEAAVDEIAPMAAETLLTPEEQTFVPEAEQPVEIPVEGEQPQTVDQTLEEELPQTVKAPEAAPETEQRTVEVKVETGEPRAERTERTEETTEETPELQEADVETPVFENVKAVPVKVGEAPKTAETQQPLEEQIAPKLSEALENGETRVELQLNPEHLGKVKVEMTWKEDGGLVVQLHAENRSTQSLLEKNLSGLEALLSRETQQEVHVEVPRQEESQRQDLYEQQQNQHKQQQERQEQKSRRNDSENFLQQLRLGLIPMEGE